VSDFYFEKWEIICELISKDFNSIKANEIINHDNDDSWIVIKHDVETNPYKALKIAEIENKYSLKCSYYVQGHLILKYPQIFKRISNMGHEVTYHYDVLDSNKGDFSLADSEFEFYLNKFSKLELNVETVCPHGNPLMNRNGWTSNKDFFRNKIINNKYPNIIDLAIHLPSLVNSYTYISDAGYSWKKIVNFGTNDITNSGDIRINDITNFLNSIRNDKIILSTHPHRWEKSKLKNYINKYFFSILKFTAKNLSRIKILKKIFSKFYFLAKKI
tara:strand:- start:100 stop:918 length:819 start_codon:yes stop_codon:yes gene_type:complete